MIDDDRENTAASMRQWSEPNVGPAWHFRFFGWLLRWGGLTRAYHISWFATLWYVLLYPSIRARTRFYLDRRFPERRGRLRRFLDSYRLIRTFGETLVDITAVGVLGRDALAARSPDRQRLADMAQGDNGFIMLHSHAGSWQVGMSTTRTFPKHFWLVLIPERRTLSMFDPDRATIIDPRTGLDGVMRMTQALLRGEIVAMMGDRTFGDERNRVSAQFLGGTIQLPVTPYRLASASGMPVVVMLTSRTSDRSYEMRLAKVINVPPGLGRIPEHYAPYAQQFADCLEQFVDQHPWQFFNFFDLWN